MGAAAAVLRRSSARRDPNHSSVSAGSSSESESDAQEQEDAALETSEYSGSEG